MSPARRLMFGLMISWSLWLPTIALAWQSPPARTTDESGAITPEVSADDEIALQDKTPPKPTTPANPQTKPPTPTTPQRPATRPPTQPIPTQPPPPAQQPPVPPQPAPQPNFNPFVNPQPNQPYLARLSRAPDMFGDFYQPLTAQIADITAGAGKQSVLHLPIAGGSQRFKNEHSRALPTDRVFGFYNHFENAAGFQTTNTNVDRFVMGFEKTFLEGNASIEMRLPLSVPVSFSSLGANFQSDTLGNLVVNLKGLLYSDESQAFSVGLAVNTPTGSDLNVSLPNRPTSTSFTVQNNAVHLIPFLAYQAAPTEDFFFNGFLQFDTPTNTNNVQILSGPAGARTSENRAINDQTLLYLDTSLGYWLYRDPDAEFLTGLAGLLELHYTTAMNNPDIVASRGGQGVTFGTNTGRLDTVNMAFGVHTQIARSTIVRAAYITPLRGGNHSVFDGEFTVAVIFRL